MALAFDGVDDAITCGLGACGFAFGPGTMAAIISGTAAADAGAILHAGASSGTPRYGLNFTNVAPGLLRARLGNTLTVAPTIANHAGWALYAAGKATGSVAVRFHKYRYDTGAWQHENSTTTPANSGVATTGAFLGGNAVDGFTAFTGAVVAVWAAVLTDAQVEALAFSLGAWWAVQPRGLWVLDQAAVTQRVNDLSGGDANEASRVGTLVSALSAPLSYGHPA